MKMMKKQQLLKPAEENDEKSPLLFQSSKVCSYANCKYQVEGKNPEIDFLSEKYYACQFVYTCFFAVHADCYGGEKIEEMEDYDNI